jgi:hypothetical protein
MKKRIWVKLIWVIVILVAVYVFDDERESDAPARASNSRVAAPADDALMHAIARRQSDVQVQGEGRVIKVLPDDNQGSRHQRFIVRLETQKTLLIAHNIDLANRVPGLGTGDTVAFFGEYEWTSQGGVVHWTHHDPAGRHVGGWIKHNGETYK